MENVILNFFEAYSFKEVNLMSEDFKEIYAKEEKELTELVQEWINENGENITCKSRQMELQCKQKNR